MDCIIKPVGNIGGLFVGAIEAAQNVRYLHRNGITHVLTLSYEEPVKFSSSDRIEHKMVKCHDQVGFSIVEIFSQVKDFINNSLQSGNLLVHCMAGISRSASICIMYLMTSRMINLAQALAIVKKARPVVRPNPGFLRQLLIFEKALFGSITSQLTQKITPYYGVQSDPSLAPGSAMQEQPIPQSPSPPQAQRQHSHQQQPYIQQPLIPHSRSQRPLLAQGYGPSQGVPSTMSSSMINTSHRLTHLTPQRPSTQLNSDFTKPLVKINAKAIDTVSNSTKDSSPLILRREPSPMGSVSKTPEPFFTPQLNKASSQAISRSPSTNQSYCFPNHTYNFQKSFYMMEQLQNRSISPFQVNYRSGFGGAFQR